MSYISQTLTIRPCVLSEALTADLQSIRPTQRLLSAENATYKIAPRGSIGLELVDFLHLEKNACINRG